MKRPNDKKVAKVKRVTVPAHFKKNSKGKRIKVKAYQRKVRRK
jgi:hypothetical protein